MLLRWSRFPKGRLTRGADINHLSFQNKALHGFDGHFLTEKTTGESQQRDRKTSFLSRTRAESSSNVRKARLSVKDREKEHSKKILRTGKKGKSKDVS